MFWKDWQKLETKQEVKNTEVKQEITIEKKPLMTEKKEEKFVDLSFKISEDDYKIYKVLFDKIKAENQKLTDEEIHRSLFVNLLTYTFAM